MDVEYITFIMLLLADHKMNNLELLELLEKLNLLEFEE